MRNITMTNDDIQKIIEEFAARLTNTRNSEDFTYKYTPNKVVLTERIKLRFTAIAWLKMRTLVENCTTEIAWHGVVEASEDRKTFTVTDILVYPQTVSGATVCTDETKYEAWHQALSDEAYNNLRFQAHSHVNMGAFPSAVDKTLYDNMLQTLSTDSYYIFMITNKSATHWSSKLGNWINIYDLKNNAIYETQDIDISISDFDMNWYTTVTNEALTKQTYVYAKDVKDNKTKVIPTYLNDKRTNSDEEYNGYNYENIFGIADEFYAADDPKEIKRKAAEEKKEKTRWAKEREKNYRYTGLVDKDAFLKNTPGRKK